MARGEAPWSNLLPMSVIVKILEAEAPKLEGINGAQNLKTLLSNYLRNSHLSDQLANNY